ncbi:hypothetical protein [Snodgrassella alvi]|jgi:hypothetical protein|uniref:hypothetical protein n=1 Tax=Snodgrassella alvi TaxID=1196083 RepID=UPI000C1F800A|nr:hypothetical protein [Snodgrassella alvi]PIT44024.1 hypothetical protein BHC51_10335 [Snodgrassella alvi]
MSFKNLYALLGVAPTASDTEIVKAMRQMAQLQLVELDDLKLCKATLLNPEERKKYNAQLFAECPEVLEELTKSKETEEAKLPPPKKTTRSKKNLYVILASVVAVGVVAGAVVYFKHYKPLWEVKDAVRDILKDPDSAKFYNIRKVVNGKLTSYCGEVNAKVATGGYGGKQRFVYEVEEKNTTLVPSSKPLDETEEVYVSALWKIRCEKLNYDEVMGDVKQWEKLESIRKEGKEAMDSLDKYKYSGSEAYTEAESLYQELVDKVDNARKKVSIY